MPSEDKLVRDVEKSLLGGPPKFRRGMLVKDNKNLLCRIEKVISTKKGQKYAIVIYTKIAKGGVRYKVRKSRWVSQLRPT